MLLFIRFPVNNHLGDDPKIPSIYSKYSFISDVFINVEIDSYVADLLIEAIGENIKSLSPDWVSAN